jgi:chloramphenicol O-acetyltransferase type A
MPFRILHDYSRRAHLDFYRNHPSPFYTVAFELDATRVRARAKEIGASTYASLVWCCHRALLTLDAFRTRLAGDDVVLYEGLRIGMTVPAPAGTYTFATPPWSPDAERFLAAARRVMAEASSRVDLSGGDAPDFAYYTALPKVPFASFTHVTLPDPTAGQPQIAFGRFDEAGDRVRVPVAVQVNHMFVHGADLGELYEAARDSFATAF